MEQPVSEDKGKAGQEVTLSVPSVDLEVEPRRFTLDTFFLKPTRQLLLPAAIVVDELKFGWGGGGAKNILEIFSRPSVVGTLEGIPDFHCAVIPRGGFKLRLSGRGTRVLAVIRKLEAWEWKINPQSARGFSPAYCQCQMNVKPPCIARLDQAELI